MILADFIIESLARKGMITPFHERQCSEGIISYGLSSFGYDARVDRQFRVFNDRPVDPKNIEEGTYEELETDKLWIPPHGFVLARTVETFDIPRNVLAICMGKSTYARCGIIVNVTPLEPEWRGKVTLEFSNTTNGPRPLYAGEGACQFLFFEGSTPEISYADRKGKYQDQEQITMPGVK